MRLVAWNACCGSTGTINPFMMTIPGECELLFQVWRSSTVRLTSSAGVSPEVTLPPLSSSLWGIDPFAILNVRLLVVCALMAPIAWCPGHVLQISISPVVTKCMQWGGTALSAEMTLEVLGSAGGRAAARLMSLYFKYHSACFFGLLKFDMNTLLIGEMMSELQGTGLYMWVSTSGETSHLRSTVASCSAFRTPLNAAIHSQPWVLTLEVTPPSMIKTTYRAKFIALACCHACLLL